MTLHNILSHLLETHILHCRLQRWVLPTPIHLPIMLPPSDPSGYPVLEPPQVPSHAGGHHPHLRSEENYCRTTAFKNTPNTLGLAPSLPSLLIRRAQLFRDLQRLLETHILHCRLQRWVLPTPIHLPIMLPPSDPSGYPVLEPPQVPSHAGGHHPHLRSEENYCRTTAFKNTPNTLGLAPSLPSLLIRRAQLFRALQRLTTTAGQSSSDAIVTRPKYLKDVTV